jgi:hypothetical protein
MAVNDFAQFRPSEGAFRNPGELIESYRAIGLERAETSIGLERFYRSLEEEGRQFDETLGFQREELGETSRQFDTKLAEEQRQFGATFGLEKERLSLEEQLSNAALNEKAREFDTETELAWAGLDLKKQIAAWEYQLGADELNLSERNSEHTKDYNWIKLGLDLLEYGSNSDWW